MDKFEVITWQFYDIGVESGWPFLNNKLNNLSTYNYSSGDQYRNLTVDLGNISM